MNTDLRLYRLDLDYVKYLHSIDNKVMYSAKHKDVYNANRPYVGVVLNINGFDYFAPLESPKPNHARLRQQEHIIFMNKGKSGIIGLNNMVPVVPDLLIDIDIEKDRYPDKLRTQLFYIRNNKKQILHNAKSCYLKRTINPNRFVRSVFCNFKRLELAALDYCISKNIPIPNNLLENKIKELGNDIQHGRSNDTESYNRLLAAKHNLQKCNMTKDIQPRTRGEDHINRG